MNLNTGLARCLSCGTVHQIGAASAPVRPAIARPTAVTEEAQGPTLTLTLRWFQPQAWFLLLFCIAWDSFLVFWYGVAVLSALGATSGGDGAAAGAGLLMVVFPIAHVAVGVGLTYYTAALFLNSTVVVVDPMRLTVRHGPLRWGAGAEVPSRQVEQLYVVERRGNKGSRTYRLAALVDGTVTLLTTGHIDSDHVRYLEQRIESHLGIVDRRIAGESL